MTYIKHDSTTQDASITLNVLDEGTDGQRLTVTFEERIGDNAYRKVLFRLNKEETEQLAHAMKRPASETCLSCANYKKYDVPENCAVYGQYYCDAIDGIEGGKMMVKYPDRPACDKYRRLVVDKDMTVKAELKGVDADDRAERDNQDD